MKASTAIILHFPSEKQAKIVANALKPETEVNPSARRSRVKVSCKENDLILEFYAKDIAALRAAINSYLHWAMLVNDSLKTMEELNK